MPLDIPTLFIVAACIVALLGLVLFFAWIQDRNMRALAWWGAAYLVGGLGVALWRLDAAVSPPLPYGSSNALIFIACGMICTGARLFHSRSIRPVRLFAGAIVWMAACQLPAFTSWSAGRVILCSLIISAYVLLTAWELWRERRKMSQLRWAAVFVPLLHGLVFLPPIPLALIEAQQPASSLSSSWMAAFTLEMLLYAVGTAFVVLMLAKEGTERIHKTEATTDPLTGLLNRRGFFENARALMRRRGAAPQKVTLLMFDLDHFKAINDTYGHAVGDEALRVFARSIQSALREGDIIGRLGGEEFAAVLPSATAEAAGAAERVRVTFERAGLSIEGHPVRATVSIGAASADVASCDLDRLLSRADAALYAAKAAGRNRIICAPAEQALQGEAVLAPKAAPESSEMRVQPVVRQKLAIERAA